MKIKSFTFNPFQENTYILYDETKECVIIDPGCYETREKQELKTFISENNLIPKRLLNTHCHLDHVFGNKFVSATYNLLPELHENDLVVLEILAQVSQMYGIPNVESSPLPKYYLDENDTIKFGNSTLEILSVPGHAPGHLVFYAKEDNFVINGDVLFKGSIGRTDLPGGNHEMLINNIKTKMFLLPDDCIVYSGHGPSTSIGFEKINNPFLS